MELGTESKSGSDQTKGNLSDFLRAFIDKSHCFEVNTTKHLKKVKGIVGKFRCSMLSADTSPSVNSTIGSLVQIKKTLLYLKKK